MRTLAIGDIHGCRAALVALMKAVKPTGDDRLVFIGDYVDRGPDSRGVIDWIIANDLGCEIVALRGNHESMMLQAPSEEWLFFNWRSCGGDATLISYEIDDDAGWDERIPDAHWEFLSRTRPFFETKTHVFVHASVDPDLPMEQQDEHRLLWTPCVGMAPHCSGRTVVCGHTAQTSGQILDCGHYVCIDTAAYGGQWLSCLDVESGDYWQANEVGETRSGNIGTQLVDSGGSGGFGPKMK